MSGTLLHNHYVIQRQLGQGGMAVVYQAEDQTLPGRFVAVKENFDRSQDAQDQFRREAMILARLRHPNLPQVTDHFVEPSGRQYLVMDYVEGDDLDDILSRRGPLPEAEVLPWMDQVLDALAYMHGWVDPVSGQPMPVVHRDIKPANIKLTPSGRVMLVDFGIAKYQTGTLTATGARAASPGFSPWEQYTGRTDTRSDVYSVGATMYNLLTNVVPPEAPDIAAGTPLVAPRSLNPAISVYAEQAILKAMATQMAFRFQCVGDLRQALRGSLVAQVAPRPCAACGKMNKSTAHYCIGCGTPLPAILAGANLTAVPTPKPAPATPSAPPPLVSDMGRVAAWSAGGALLGLALACLPALAIPGSGSGPAATVLYAGEHFFCALGAAAGALGARRANLDTADFLPRFIITFMLALALQLVVGPALGLAPTYLTPLVGILAIAGAVAGSLAGVWLTERSAFRSIKWA
jgi:serine/threonine-protein kinase